MYGLVVVDGRQLEARLAWTLTSAPPSTSISASLLHAQAVDITLSYKSSRMYAVSLCLASLLP